MAKEEILDKLQKLVIFGVNNSAILYNKQRLENPDKYNLRYQLDHYLLQVRRSTDPNFYRYIFKQSHISHNFISNRAIVIKAVIRDLCVGKFNTEQLSGVVELETVHKKNKNGDFHPRQTRRRINEDLGNFVYKKGHTEKDGREITYGTPFGYGFLEGGIFPDDAKKMWQTEKEEYSSNSIEIAKTTNTAFLIEVFPERWQDIIEMRKKMLLILGELESESGYSEFHSALYNEILSFSRIFITLCNHINSICETFWFMRKSEKIRMSMLKSKSKLDLQDKEIIESFELLKEMRWKPDEIGNNMVLAANALFILGYSDLAISIYRKILSLDIVDSLKIAVYLEEICVLRNIERFQEMLNISQFVVNSFKLTDDNYFHSLLRIRHSEALAFNGKRGEAVEILESIYAIRNKHSGFHQSFGNSMAEAINLVLYEKEQDTKKYISPNNVSLLKNLLMAAFRIQEYCLCKKYTEELLEIGREYFKGEDKFEEFMGVHEIYNKVIFLCNKTN